MSLGEPIQNTETRCWICYNRDDCERYSDYMKEYCPDFIYGDKYKVGNEEEEY